MSILDVPIFCWQKEDYSTAYYRLKKADQITCISEFVQFQITQNFNLDSTVINIPAKDVYYNPLIQKDLPFLYVGRACDSGKRFELIKEAFRTYGIDEKYLVVVGSENPGFGQYVGVVSDEELNRYYNRAFFTLLPSKIEGVGLSMIESLICHTVPVLCKDNLAAVEFAPEFCVDPINFGAALVVMQDMYEHFEKIACSYGVVYSRQFSKARIAENIIHVYKSIS